MRTLVFAAAVAALAAPVLAAGPQGAQLSVEGAWSRPAAAGMNGAGFMVLTNRGRAADALTAVETPAAARVEIHQTSTEGGVTRMRKLESAPLAPGQSVRFEPGGRHLMLIGLKQPLKAGDKVPATLIFSSGARLKAEFAVGAGAPAAHDHHAHH